MFIKYQKRQFFALFETKNRLNPFILPASFSRLIRKKILDFDTLKGGFLTFLKIGAKKLFYPVTLFTVPDAGTAIFMILPPAVLHKITPFLMVFFCHSRHRSHLPFIRSRAFFYIFFLLGYICACLIASSQRRRIFCRFDFINFNFFVGIAVIVVHQYALLPAVVYVQRYI